MKLVTYLDPLEPEVPDFKLGALLNDECVIDLAVAQTWAQGAKGFRARELPLNMLGILQTWDKMGPHINALLDTLPTDEDCTQLKGAGRKPVAHAREDVFLLSPLLNALTLRLFTGFEKHMRNIYRLRSRAIPKEWYTAPMFTYGNPLTIIGPDQAVVMPAYGTALDYELGLACIIGQQGRNIAAEEAVKHIAGYTMMCNWSLRDVERQEISATKSKDFATTLGPALVTPDELTERQIGEGAELRYDLTMTANVNGEKCTHGNFGDIHWTFGQMIERASQDVTLLPGEVIGSGPVETGCLFEMGAEDTDEWLKPGDNITLAVEGIGTFITQIIERRKIGTPEDNRIAG